jgi:hypothetical protein
VTSIDSDSGWSSISGDSHNSLVRIIQPARLQSDPVASFRLPAEARSDEANPGDTQAGSLRSFQIHCEHM